MGYKISVNYTLNIDNYKIRAIVEVLSCDPGLYTEILKTSTDKYVSKRYLGPFDIAEQAEMQVKAVIDNARTRIEWLRTKAPPKSKIIEI